MGLALDLIGLGMPPAQAELLEFAIEGAIPGEPIIVAASPYTVLARTTSIAIERVGPTATAITLPTVLAQDGVPLTIVDWSTSVVGHTITVTPAAGQVIGRQSSWTMLSNSGYLAVATFYPSTGLNGWFVK